VDAWVRSAVEGITAEPAPALDWPTGHRDGWGRGWEKLTADAAHRLASLSLADWNGYALDQAHDHYFAAAPTDSTWTTRQVREKWTGQCARATPAPWPAFPDEDSEPP
jgi:hypothetical protein